MFNLLSLFFSPIHCDAPEAWQIGFQDGASPTFEGITELHNSIFFYLIVISVGVAWVLGSVVVNFSSDKSPIVYKYANHGTLIELVWTITPAFILIAIAFPSFKLLYLMDFSLECLDYYCFKSGASLLAVVLGKRKAVPIKSIKSNCTAIVAHGVPGWSLGFLLSQYCRVMTTMTMQVRSIITGHLLGDGSLNITHTSVNPYFVFTQTIKRFWYVWHVFQQLGAYCQSLPRLTFSIRQGTSIGTMQILTRSYSFFLFFYHIFYVMINGVRAKIVPLELVYLLDPLALAVWAMDDGSYTPSGFYFHTEKLFCPRCSTTNWVITLQLWITLYPSIQRR